MTTEMTTDERNTKRHEAFRRLAEKRVNRALDVLRTIGNLGSPNYASTEVEREAIRDALFSAAQDAIARLEPSSKAAKPSFSL